MTKIVTSIVALVVFPIALGHAAVAAAAGGAQNGRPAFEHVHSLAFDAGGRSLWLGAHTGLFRSEDRGATWTKVSLPVQHDAPDVMAVTPDPRDAGVLYVGTHEAGVLKTTDGGRTWAEVNNGLGGRDVHGVAVDPNAPAKLVSFQ